MERGHPFFLMLWHKKWVSPFHLVKNGMTLLEVLVAMLLLGLIVMGMFAAFSIVGSGPGKLGSLELQAANYARETLEKLKNAVSEDAVRAALLDAGTDKVDALPTVDFKTVYGGARTYTVEDVDKDGDGVTDYKRVTVMVRWND